MDSTKVTLYHLISQAGWNRCNLSIYSAQASFHLNSVREMLPERLGLVGELPSAQRGRRGEKRGCLRQLGLCLTPAALRNKACFDGKAFHLSDGARGLLAWP